MYTPLQSFKIKKPSYILHFFSPRSCFHILTKRFEPTLEFSISCSLFWLERHFTSGKLRSTILIFANYTYNALKYLWTSTNNHCVIFWVELRFEIIILLYNLTFIMESKPIVYWELGRALVYCFGGRGGVYSVNILTYWRIYKFKDHLMLCRKIKLCLIQLSQISCEGFVSLAG